MIILSFLILLWIINSRIYDNIYLIQKNIIKNIHKLSLNFAINGTNDFLIILKVKIYYFILIKFLWMKTTKKL